MLRSHAVIETTNIHFVVHKGATLLFRAPAMTIARDEVRIACTAALHNYMHTRTDCIQTSHRFDDGVFCMTVGKCCCCTDGVQTTRGKHCHTCLVRTYAWYLVFFVAAVGVERAQGQQAYYYFNYCCSDCNTIINRYLIPVQP